VNAGRGFDTPDLKSVLPLQLNWYTRLCS